MKAPTFISMVASASQTATRHIQADKIIQAIKHGKWRTPVEQIRRLYAETILRAGDREAVKKAAKLAVAPLKKKLPAILLSGRFRQRSNGALIQHSGLICADLDDLGSEALKAVRPKLLTSPYLWAVFRSPTGKGLKAILRVPADPCKHLASFRAVEKHIRDLTGIQIDQSCKDPARLCFVSYDPDCYFNPDAGEIDPFPEPEKPKPVIRTKSDGSKPDKEQIREMLAVIPKRPQYHDWITIVAAVGDALPVADAEEVLDEWSPEEQPGEYAKKLASGFEKIHVGTLIREAQKHGWHLRNPANLIGEPGSIVDVDTQRKCEISEPEPLELPPPPVPYTSPQLDLLPSELQDYICAAAESINVDVAFILLPKLSSLATAIGNSRSIRLKRGFVQPPIIWNGIVARSGGRKSPSEQEGCFPIMMHERELMRQNKEAAEIYADELSKWQSQRGKGREDKPEEPPFNTCTCDDLTIEVLADILGTNPRGILVRKDELSHWLASFDQYKPTKGSDVSRWLSLHTAVFLAVDRRTDSRHYRIENPRVSITGGIQPKILRRALTPEFFERGLPARFIFAYPPFRQDKWSEATVPDDLRARVLDLFSELWLLQPKDHNPQLLPLDRDAKAVFVDFYNKCGESALEASEHEEAAWGKLSGYGARFALIGQLAHNPRAEVVTGAIMEAACKLARWSGNEAVRIYGEIAQTEEQREQREFVEFIERRGGAVSEREVMQSFTRLKNDKEGAARELDALVKAGRGKWERVDHGGEAGRPARKFRLLRSSTSTQFGILRGKMKNSVDVGSSSSQNITPQVEPNTEAVSCELAAMPAGLLEL